MRHPGSPADEVRIRRAVLEDMRRKHTELVERVYPAPGGPWPTKAFREAEKLLDKAIRRACE